MYYIMHISIIIITLSSHFFMSVSDYIMVMLLLQKADDGTAVGKLSD